MLDSIYWAADVANALMRIARVLKPGGQIATLIVQIPAYCHRPEELEIDDTLVAAALSKLHFDYQAHDYTTQFREFWLRVKEAAVALREDFKVKAMASFARTGLERPMMSTCPL